MGTNALGGYVVAQTVVASVTAAVAGVVDSVVATIAVPNEATILDVILTVTDMDTGATLTFDVGDASGPTVPDDNRFISAFSGQAAGSIRASDSAGLLEGIYTYAAPATAQVEQEIECTILAAAATGVAGTVTMTVIHTT